MGTQHQHGRVAQRFDRAFAIGIALNAAFVAIEAAVGWRIDSLALLADAGHNLSDVAGLVQAWGGAMAGRLRPDVRHTYGWKRASILAAFVNAVLLLVAMGSLAWEAAHRLLEAVSHELHARFGIEHVTMQIMGSPVGLTRGTVPSSRQEHANGAQLGERERRSLSLTTGVQHEYP